MSLSYVIYVEVFFDYRNFSSTHFVGIQILLQYIFEWKKTEKIKAIICEIVSL